MRYFQNITDTSCYRNVRASCYFRNTFVVMCKEPNIVNVRFIHTYVTCIRDTYMYVYTSVTLCRYIVELDFTLCGFMVIFIARAFADMRNYFPRNDHTTQIVNKAIPQWAWRIRIHCQLYSPAVCRHEGGVEIGNRYEFRSGAIGKCGE